MAPVEPPWSAAQSPVNLIVDMLLLLPEALDGGVQ